MKNIILLSFTFVLTLIVSAQVRIPESIKGNWFRNDNAQWEISLLDSVAIYKSKVWGYADCVIKEGTGRIGLKNGNVKLTLYTKQEGEGICMIGEKLSKLTKYTNKPVESAIPINNEKFELPIFKKDTAIYCGYIRNYNLRTDQRTGMVYLNDILSGDQVPFLFSISDNGYFAVKIPLYNPQIISVEQPFGYELVFIEPGKTTFEFIPGKKQQVMFMGDNARVNNDLLKLKHICSFTFTQIKDKILDFTPVQYRLFCENSLSNDLFELRSISDKNRICYKANKIWSLSLIYRSASELLFYQTNFETAYEIKNKKSITKNDTLVIIEKPDIKYYSFLTKDLLNDPLAIITFDYGFFIDRLKYMEILRAPNNNQDDIHRNYKESAANYRNEKLIKLLGFHPDFTIDVMNAQDICLNLEKEMIPLTDEKLRLIQKRITAPFISSYIKVKNEEIKSRIESNKLAAKSKTGFVLREVPKTAGDKVFEAIMANYKGKVVYIDFWATWCLPCREGIAKIKPLKDELAEENVAFIYITNQSSPKMTYQNMIPDIKGDHYRLSADEWNILTGKFKISGIPHYVLVGRDGQVINPHLGHMENGQLKNLLMKYIKG